MELASISIYDSISIYKFMRLEKLSSNRETDGIETFVSSFIEDLVNAVIDVVRSSPSKRLGLDDNSLSCLKVKGLQLLTFTPSPVWLMTRNYSSNWNSKAGRTEEI